MPLVHRKEFLSLKDIHLRQEELENLPPGIQAGILLFLGKWDAAHNIAQDLHTKEGSYWHAIIHRQEPDSWNSNYWFRQVGTHPVFTQLTEQGSLLIQSLPASGFSIRGKWDASQFTHFCETVRSGSKEENLAIQLQHLEWKLLMNHCCEGIGI